MIVAALAFLLGWLCRALDPAVEWQIEPKVYRVWLLLGGDRSKVWREPDVMISAQFAYGVPCWIVWTDKPTKQLIPYAVAWDRTLVIQTPKKTYTPMEGW